MWFLQAGTFVGISLICLAMLLTGRLRFLDAKKRMLLLALMCTAFVAWVSLRLLLFYLAYIMAVFCISRIRPEGRYIKNMAFVFSVILCAAPLFFVRLWQPGQAIVIIGLAFAVLRSIDAIFYTHYTDEKLRFVVFFNYMMFIPTFTAGPVFRYRDFDKAAKSIAPVAITDFAEAFKRIVRGLLKSIVVAQILMQIFAHFSQGDTPYTAPVSVLLVVCSYLILFFDLSGYADIAIAFGRLCGFTVPENFKKPWRSASFTQFWRSWHSTVSDWIREHVHVVLHNKQMNKPKAAFAAMVVMVVMALWHGFNFPTLIMGAYLGTLLALENLLGLTSPKKKWTPVRVLRCFAVNFLFGVNTLLFVTDFQNAIDIVSGLFRV
ncbi:MAG: hypothetical protein FWB97_06180 [Oscillospiraceae bacterium]|nr:hypothetical protein [Oscillospiraceae bacterium]